MSAGIWSSEASLGLDNPLPIHLYGYWLEASVPCHVGLYLGFSWHDSWFPPEQVMREKQRESGRKETEPSLLECNLRSNIPSLLPSWSYTPILVNYKREITWRCGYQESGIIGGHLGVWLPHLAYVIPCSYAKKELHLLAIKQICQIFSDCTNLKPIIVAGRIIATEWYRSGLLSQYLFQGDRMIGLDSVHLELGMWFAATQTAWFFYFFFLIF